LADKQAFYDALGRVEPAAIRVLAEKITYNTGQAVLRAALSAEDAQELVNDAVLITITNIQNQTFLFSDFSPAVYANGVVQNLSPYTSTTSLKSKRSQCMNKLIELARKMGIVPEI
jgi:hypothetical protein